MNRYTVLKWINFSSWAFSYKFLEVVRTNLILESVQNVFET